MQAQQEPQVWLPSPEYMAVMGKDDLSPHAAEAYNLVANEPAAEVPLVGLPTPLAIPVAVRQSVCTRSAYSRLGVWHYIVRVVMSAGSAFVTSSFHCTGHSTDSFVV